jgi:hypothetical protein
LYGLVQIIYGSSYYPLTLSPAKSSMLMAMDITGKFRHCYLVENETQSSEIEAPNSDPMKSCQHQSSNWSADEKIGIYITYGAGNYDSGIL